MTDRIDQGKLAWAETISNEPEQLAADPAADRALQKILAALVRCDNCDGSGRVKKGAWVEPTFVDCPDHRPHVVLAERECKHGRTGPCGLVRLGSGDAVCPGGGVVVLESEYHASQYGDEHDVIVARLDDD